MPRPNDKAFDPEENRICDPIAKRISGEVCAAMGMTNIRENSEGRYRGHIYDIVAEYQGHTLRIETELKKEWGPKYCVPRQEEPDVPYRWDTMDFPYRKRDKAKVHAHVHDVVSGDQKHVFRVVRPIVLAAPVENKYVRNRCCEEPFFKVALPAPSSTFFEKVDGAWRIARRWDESGKLTIKDGVKL